MPPDQPAPQGRLGAAHLASPGGGRARPDVAPAAAVEPCVVLKPEPRASRRSRRRRWLDDLLGAEDAAEVRSLNAGIRARIDHLVERSQPLTASLCVHAIAIILLALLFVRVNRERHRQIRLSFAPAAPVDADRPGVQIEKHQTDSSAEAKEKPAPAGDTPATDQMSADSGAESLPFVAPAVGSLLEGRAAGQREELVREFGGGDATEKAVARALHWLVRRQDDDGLWRLAGSYADHAAQENRVAATAMALMALQGAGNTTRAGTHHDAVAKAWKALLKRQVAGHAGESVERRRRSGSGSFVISSQDPPARQKLYAHAQATIAICELYGMTKDTELRDAELKDTGLKDTDLKTAAQQAVAYALAAQGPNGGWRYEPGQNGDMSVTGWFMMALKSAEMAGLDVPQETYDGVTRFLDAVSRDQGSRYGYRFDDLTAFDDPGGAGFVRREAGPVSEAVSAEGLLCRQFLGWPRSHPPLIRGVRELLANKPLNWATGKDVYAWYYITQVVHNLGGTEWAGWNDGMRELLPSKQVDRGDEQGSWDPSGDQWGPWGGRLFTTCFCTYMLEIYYRHRPLYGQETVIAAGAAPD